MHNIKTNFDKIPVVIKDILSDEINENGNYLRRGTKPRFSDIEVIALSLTAEIRAKFFELLCKLEGYKSHIVVAKKDLNIFNRKHNNNPSEFYFDVLHHLLNCRLFDTSCEYQLYLSQRGNNTLHCFEKAVENALQANEEKTEGKVKFRLRIVPARESEGNISPKINNRYAVFLQKKSYEKEAKFHDILFPGEKGQTFLEDVVFGERESIPTIIFCLIILLTNRSCAGFMLDGYKNLDANS